MESGLLPAKKAQARLDDAARLMRGEVGRHPDAEDMLKDIEKRRVQLTREGPNAVGEASRALLTFDHPVFWSAFHLVGRVT